MNAEHFPSVREVYDRQHNECGSFTWVMAIVVFFIALALYFA